MAERMVIRAAWGYQDFVLKSGVVAEKGKLAVIDTADGSITKGGVATTLVPLGIFAQSLTGDGIKTVTIEMFYEIGLRWWNNDSGGGSTPVVAADIGQAVYIKDDQTVSGSATGRSALGIALKLDTVKGVLVYSGYPAPAFVP